MSNPFDQLELARDLVRQDECLWLFNKVREEQKREPDTDGGYVDGYYAGLEFVSNLLDERVGFLRDRWG